MEASDLVTLQQRWEVEVNIRAELRNTFTSL